MGLSAAVYSTKDCTGDAMMNIAMTGKTTGDSSCNSMAMKMGSARRLGAHEGIQYSHETRSCEGDSVQTASKDCKDKDCSSCVDSGKESVTSAEFDAEMAKFTAGGCVMMEEGVYAIITVNSGAPPANPCSAAPSSSASRVSSRLHKAIAF